MDIVAIVKSIAAAIEYVYGQAVYYTAQVFQAVGFSAEFSTVAATYVVDAAIVYGLTRLTAQDPVDPAQAQRRTFAMRPDQPRMVVYGKAWLSPTIVSQSSDDRALFIVSALCDHKLKGVDDIQIFHQAFLASYEKAQLRNGGCMVLRDDSYRDISNARYRIFSIQYERYAAGARIPESGAAYSEHDLMFIGQGFNGENIADTHKAWQDENKRWRYPYGHRGSDNNYMYANKHFLPMKAGPGSGAPLGFYNMKMDGVSWMTFGFIKIPKRYNPPTWQSVPPVSVLANRGNRDLAIRFLWSNFNVKYDAEEYPGASKDSWLSLDRLRTLARVLIFQKKAEEFYDRTSGGRNADAARIWSSLLLQRETSDISDRQNIEDVWDYVQNDGETIEVDYDGYKLSLEPEDGDSDIKIQVSNSDRPGLHNIFDGLDDGYFSSGGNLLSLSQLKLAIYTTLTEGYFSNGNAALCIADFLNRYTPYKEEICGTKRIDVASVLQAAEDCENYVDINGENAPLTANGAMPINRPDAALQQLTMAMNMGSIVEAGGIRYVYAGKGARETIQIGAEDIKVNSETGNLETQLAKTSSVNNRTSAMNIKFIDGTGTSQTIGIRTKLPNGNLTKRTTVGNMAFAFIDNRKQALQCARISLDRQWHGSVLTFPLINTLKTPRPNDVIEVDIPEFRALPSRLFRVVSVSNGLNGVVAIQAVNESPGLYRASEALDTLSEIPPPDLSAEELTFEWNDYATEDDAYTTIPSNPIPAPGDEGDWAVSNILIHPANPDTLERNEPGGGYIGTHSAPAGGDWGDLLRIN